MENIEFLIGILELVIGVLLLMLILLAVLVQTLRKKIKTRMQHNESRVFDEYFSNSGIFNRSIQSSAKLGKFFVTPHLWKGVEDEKTIKLLSYNRIIELIYFSCFASLFILFVLSLYLMAQR